MGLHQVVKDALMTFHFKTIRNQERKAFPWGNIGQVTEADFWKSRKSAGEKNRKENLQVRRMELSH